MDHSTKKKSVKFSAAHPAIAFGAAVGGVAVAGAGIYVGEKDDAPGAALLGIVLMACALVFALKVALRRRRSE